MLDSFGSSNNFLFSFSKYILYEEKITPAIPIKIIINPTDFPWAILSNQLDLSKYKDSKNPLVGSIEAALYSSALWCLLSVFRTLLSGCLWRSSKPPSSGSVLIYLELYDAENKPYLIILSSKASPLELMIFDLNSFISPEATISLKYSNHNVSSSLILWTCICPISLNLSPLCGNSVKV